MSKTIVTAGWILALTFPCASLAAEHTPERIDAQSKRTLDLKAPEIGRIFSPQQINAVLARATDPALENVEVEALRLDDLPFKDRSASPTQSVARTAFWLLFGTRPNPTRDAADADRPAPYLQTNHHAAFDTP
jgi:hypothetical protein